MTENSRPVIGITMGDPAGIGPEVVLKAVADRAVRKYCVPILIGDLGHLESVATNLGLPVRFESYSIEGGFPGDESTAVWDLGNLADASIAAGVESSEAGAAAAEYIIASVELWKKGVIDAVCTAPINKKALEMAGYDFPGHTEFLADLTDTREFRMSFMCGDLRVVLLSTHLSLKDAIAFVKKENLIDLIRFTDREMTSLLGRRPSIAVAGLNPHASEGGLFGDEEASEIRPAVEHCSMVAEIDVSGPFSPDTIFLRGFKGEFDAVVACYHDQATVAVKCLSFGKGVNVTLGLPLIRTSVDHGTAFEIAGKGVADHGSMLAAIEMAASLTGSSRNSAHEAEV